MGIELPKYLRNEIFKNVLHFESRRQVAFAVRTNVMYDGTLDDECPVHGSAVSFKIGDYLHIFEKFDANWWVGRKVKENCDIGFIPSPDRLEQLILQKAPVGKLDRFVDQYKWSSL